MAQADDVLSISAAFDAGNIEVVDSSNPQDIQLKIRAEPFTHGTDEQAHMQWFYFRASNAKGVRCVYNITNAGESSYAEDFEGYHTAASYDQQNWFRVKSTSYESGILRWDLTAA